MTVAARQSGLKGALGTGILSLLAFVGSERVGGGFGRGGNHSRIPGRH